MYSGGAPQLAQYKVVFIMTVSTPTYTAQAFAIVRDRSVDRGIGNSYECPSDVWQQSDDAHEHDKCYNARHYDQLKAIAHRCYLDDTQHSK